MHVRGMRAHAMQQASRPGRRQRRLVGTGHSCGVLQTSHCPPGLRALTLLCPQVNGLNPRRQVQAACPATLFLHAAPRVCACLIEALSVHLPAPAISKVCQRCAGLWYNTEQPPRCALASRLRVHACSRERLSTLGSSEPSPRAWSAPAGHRRAAVGDRPSPAVAACRINAHPQPMASFLCRCSGC